MNGENELASGLSRWFFAQGLEHEVFEERLALNHARNLPGYLEESVELALGDSTFNVSSVGRPSPRPSPQRGEGALWHGRFTYRALAPVGRGLG